PAPDGPREPAGVEHQDGRGSPEPPVDLREGPVASVRVLVVVLEQGSQLVPPGHGLRGRPGVVGSLAHADDSRRSVNRTGVPGGSGASSPVTTSGPSETAKSRARAGQPPAARSLRSSSRATHAIASV